MSGRRPRLVLVALRSGRREEEGDDERGDEEEEQEERGKEEEEEEEDRPGTLAACIRRGMDPKLFQEAVEGLVASAQARTAREVDADGFTALMEAAMLPSRLPLLVRMLRMEAFVATLGMARLGKTAIMYAALNANVVGLAALLACSSTTAAQVFGAMECVVARLDGSPQELVMCAQAVRLSPPAPKWRRLEELADRAANPACARACRWLADWPGREDPVRAPATWSGDAALDSFMWVPQFAAAVTLGRLLAAVACREGDGADRCAGLLADMTEHQTAVVCVRDRSGGLVTVVVVHPQPQSAAPSPRTFCVGVGVPDTHQWNGRYTSQDVADKLRQLLLRGAQGGMDKYPRAPTTNIDHRLVPAVIRLLGGGLKDNRVLDAAVAYYTSGPAGKEVVKP